MAGERIRDQEPGRGVVAHLGQQRVFGELPAPPAGFRRLSYAEGGSGGHGEGVAGPAPGAGERVEGGRLGHRVARAPGKLDCLFGAQDRLLHVVVRVSLDRAERVRDHRRLGQRDGCWLV
ncbi:hypothetical protein [Streptomyces sp. KR55]|uniref:hypothetical protein n=1 Tax=Streptomyces sp. KR55 TaxID=3457425 RepID=UPI003FD0D983